MSLQPPMSYMKEHNPKWVFYIAWTFCGLAIIVSPIVAKFIIDITNPNISSYLNEILAKHFVKLFLIMILVAGILNLPLLFLNNRWRKYFIIFNALTVYFIALMDLFHVLLFNDRANSSSFYAVISSHSNEALEFILNYINWKLFIGTLSITVVTFLIYHVYVYHLTSLLKKFVAGSLCCMYVVSMYVYFRNSDLHLLNELSIHRFYTTYQDYKNEINIFKSKAGMIKSLNVRKADIGNETHIIVIGESTSSYHMQLYGYVRNTTPELQKLKDELLVFENVRSTHVHTIASLKDVLLLKDTTESIAAYSIIDLFNQSGYHTYWLSNQKFLGGNEALISAIAERANRKIYISPLGEDKYDGSLIQQLDNVLTEEQPRKIIFVHLMGTHLNYHDRYPAKFNTFKTKNISPFGNHADSYINSYDNAVLYNDYVVSEIIKRSKKLDVISSVVWFSDHGDEVYDYRDFHGHSESMLSKYMNTVPFIIYGNARMKAKDERLSGVISPDKPLSLRSVASTLQDLYKIESDFSDSNQSFLSLINQDKVSTAQTDSLYPLIPPAFPVIEDKIWVHRVNSIERLEFVQDLFKGIELDIVYENGSFDVNHPPAESINLNLDNYFSNVHDIKKHYFWLDLKNLNAGNQQEILNALNRVTQKFPVKDHIIIESPEVSLLKILKNSGYHTSYYLPDLASTREDDVEENKEGLRRQISYEMPEAVSQSINNYEMMKYYFPSYNKLVWSSLDWENNDNHERILDLLKKDSTIKVFLVNYDTPGWR